MIEIRDYEKDVDSMSNGYFPAQATTLLPEALREEVNRRYQMHTTLCQL